jgi:hypothetical protein
MKKITYISLRSISAALGALVSAIILPDSWSEIGFVSLVMMNAFGVSWLILMRKPDMNRFLYTALTTIFSVYVTTLIGAILVNINEFHFSKLIPMFVVTTVGLPYILLLSLPGLFAFIVFDLLFVHFFSNPVGQNENTIK